jgi:hypothetical protein
LTVQSESYDGPNPEASVSLSSGLHPSPACHRVRRARHAPALAAGGPRGASGANRSGLLDHLLGQPAQDRDRDRWPAHLVELPPPRAWHPLGRRCCLCMEARAARCVAPIACGRDPGLARVLAASRASLARAFHDIRKILRWRGGSPSIIIYVDHIPKQRDPAYSP